MYPFATLIPLLLAIYPAIKWQRLVTQVTRCLFFLWYVMFVSNSPSPIILYFISIYTENRAYRPEKLGLVCRDQIIIVAFNLQNPSILVPEYQIRFSSFSTTSTEEKSKRLWVCVVTPLHKKLLDYGTTTATISVVMWSQS